MAANDDGVYIADGVSNSILFFPWKGEARGEHGQAAEVDAGEVVTGPGELKEPAGLAVTDDGQLCG